jgi:hypothetical protein
VKRSGLQNKLKKIVLMGFLISSVLFNVKGQDLSEHQWENRLLLVFAETKDSELLTQQIELLKKDMAGLEDRKLVIYQSTSTEYLKGIEDKKWKLSQTLYRKYNKSDEPFLVVLIGLDGSVKLTKKTLLYKEELYSKIDAMPMRRNELNSR